MKSLKLYLISFPLLLLGCGPAKDLPQYTMATPVEAVETQALTVLDPKDQRIFYLLPTSGMIMRTKTLWSGNDWKLPWEQYQSPGWLEAFFMTQEELATLSPAEKYDLYTSRYQYPLKEMITQSSEENLRLGWTLATLHHPEPTAKTLGNGEGIKVPFSSSDIKALLSYYYQTHEMSDYKEIGRNEKLNAGTFHVTLANNIAMKNKSLLVDGHPVKGFASRVEEELRPEQKNPTGTTRVLKVRSKVTYISSTENSWDPVLGTPLQKNFTKEYLYYLYLNLNNEILGGDWLSEESAELMAVAGAIKKFEAPLEKLDQLLNE